MNAFLSHAGRILPDWPARRFTVFTGSNSWREWFAACGSLVSGGGGLEAVRRYESLAAAATGTRYAISFGAGRMGLYALLEALNLEPGDEIILPGFTCAAVPNALIYRRLVPIYVDIDPLTFNIDSAGVESMITPRTRAIYAQHTFGISCDIRRLREIAARHALFLIEDLAHSLGARYHGNLHGSLGDAAYFSTDRTKIINTHIGGCVITSDAALAARLRQSQRRSRTLGALTRRKVTFSFLAEFLLEAPCALWIGRPLLGALRRLGLLFYWTDEQFDTLPPGYPYPCGLSPGAARLGSSQLQSLASNLAHRRRIARWLEDRIGWYGQALPGPLEDQAWLRYSFLVDDRAEFIRRCAGRINLGIWFPEVIFCRGINLSAVRYEPGMCPRAERVARHIVNLPTHPRIPLPALEALWSRHGPWVTSHLLRFQ